MLPDVKDEKNRKQILENIKILRLIIGEEIDSTKTGVKPKLPISFAWQKIKHDDSQDVLENKKKHNAWVPRYKPYFFIYRSAEDYNKYTQYQSYMNILCQ